MTIASNRIRFLDRETRILVQDFSDLSDNTPLTDVETPFSIEAMDLIEAGYAMLLTFGREIIALLDSLSDGNITDFLINTILNNIRLNVPGFPAVARALGCSWVSHLSFRCTCRRAAEQSKRHPGPRATRCLRGSATGSRPGHPTAHRCSRTASSSRAACFGR